MYLYESDLKGIGELSGLAGGLGARPEMPARLTPQQAAINKTRIMAQRMVTQRMLERQKEIARKLGLPASTIGVFNGMGHIMSYWDGLKSAEWPSTHNAKHDGKTWPKVPLQYDSATVALVKNKNGMSQYEIEHMNPIMFNQLAVRAKAGVSMKLTGGAVPDPAKVASEAFKQDVIDRAKGAATATVDTVKAGYEAASRAVQKTGQAAVDVFKYPFELVNKFKWYILGGVGLVGLFVAWPYISAARAPGKALQKKFG